MSVRLSGGMLIISKDWRNLGKRLLDRMDPTSEISDISGPQTLNPCQKISVFYQPGSLSEKAREEQKQETK